LIAEKALLKPASRFLGIAESGIMGASHSILGGVVIRRDLLIDGMVWDRATIRGTDSTETILRMVKRLDRTDINGIMLHGTVIAGYNIIDMAWLVQETSLPVISVTKQPQEDLKSHLQSTFPSKWEHRWKIAQQNGEIKALEINANSCVYVQYKECEYETVKGIIKGFTHFGTVPEPVRVARLFSRSLIDAEKQK
jgi:endonuclease V-like protein UPF0215 family